jgi:hypothetical protein
VKTGDVVFDVIGNKRYSFVGPINPVLPTTTEAMILTEENFLDTSRWTPLTVTAFQDGDIAAPRRTGERVIKRELDTLFLNIPDIYAAPGSVYIERDDLSVVEDLVAKATYQALVNAQRIIARAGAQISIFNQSPFTTVINDAIVRDNKKVQVIDGVYTVFEPGNAWLNSYKLTNNSNTAAPAINIAQDSFPIGYYDLGGANPNLATVLSSLDQDLYIVGDVINESGALRVDNREGSIIVSGTLRAETIDVTAARDFSLNTDGWFHTNKDPRQYISYDAQRAAAVTYGTTPAAADASGGAVPAALRHQHQSADAGRLQIGHGRAGPVASRSTPTNRASWPRARSRSPRVTSTSTA